ncbi:hypothetical protein MMC19_007165 [Ptychographa xylographoides]|nr:hypothetical protein [Ptychographa xylographoides]
MRTSYLPVICISLSLLIASKTTRALVLDRAAQPLITPAPVARHILEKRDALTWAYVLGSSSFGPLDVDLETHVVRYSPSTLPQCIVYSSILGPQEPDGLSSFGCGTVATTLLALGSVLVDGVAAPSATPSSNPFAGLEPTLTAVSSANAAPSSTSTSAAPTVLTSSSSSASSSSSQFFITTESSFASSADSGSAPTSPSSAASSGSSGTSGTTGGGSSSSGSNTSNSGTTSSNRLDTGAIVGIVAGCVSLVAIFVAIWLKWPKTITRFLSCGTCTTVDDDDAGTHDHPRSHGIPMRYVPHRYDQPYANSYS